MTASLPNALKCIVCVLLLGVAIVTGGCERTDPRETVNDTVEEMTGTKNLDRFQQLSDDLDQIQNQQTRTYRQLDPNEDDR